MNELLHHRGYDGSVLYSAEDHLLHGRILGIRDFVLYDGHDVETLEQNFREAVDEYLQFCDEDKRSPGKPLLDPEEIRVSEPLQQRISRFAAEHHVALTHVVEQALTEFLEHAE